MIRSRLFKEHDLRDRLAEMRWGLRRTIDPWVGRPFCMFRNGRLSRGWQSTHRTPEARRWRTVLRMKARRELDEAIEWARAQKGKHDGN